MKNKNITLYIFTALLTFLITAIMFTAHGLYPFGPFALPISDLRGQYTDFLQWFERCVKGGDSFLYSFSVGLGSNSLAFAAYYLFSPLNVLALIIKDEMVLVTVLYRAKLLLCALCACAYFVNSRIIRKKSVFYKALIPLLSASYAFCGFCAVYATNIIWLDTVSIFALTVLGAEILYFEKRSVLFSLGIGFGIIFNFYIGLMAAVFALVYLVFLALWDTSGFRGMSVLDAAAAFSRGICIGAIALLPSLYDLASKKAADDNLFGSVTELLPTVTALWSVAAVFILALTLFVSGRPELGEEKKSHAKLAQIIALVLCVFFAVIILFGKYSIGELFRALLAGGNKVEIPQLYTSSIWILAIAAVVIKRKNIRRNLCITALCLSGFVFLQSETADLLLHFGQEPISFPHRYTFAISFFILIGAGYVINSLNIRKKEAALVLTLICGAELCFNAVNSYTTMNAHWGVPFEKNTYDKYYAEMNKTAKKIGNGPYRAEKSFFRTSNEQMSFGYNGLSHYSSLLNRDISHFSKSIGLLQSDRSLLNTGATPFIDSLLGIKYYADTQDEEFLKQTKCVSIRKKQYCNDYYSTENSDSEKIALYRNDNALSPAFITDSAVKKISLEAGNPFENQNILASAMTGLYEDMFILQNPFETENINEFNVTATTGGAVFIRLDKKTDEFSDIYVNDELIYSNTPQDMFGVQQNTAYAGIFEEGEEFKIVIDSKQKFGRYDFMCYVMSNDVYSQVSQILNGKEAHINVFEHNKIQIKSDYEGVLFTTIPYENGWSAEINGKKTVPQNVLGFMCFDLKGENNIIDMKYTPPGASAGVIITCISLIAVLAAWYFERKRN